MTELKRKEVQE